MFSLIDQISMHICRLLESVLTKFSIFSFLPEVLTKVSIFSFLPEATACLFLGTPVSSTKKLTTMIQLNNLSKQPDNNIKINHFNYPISYCFISNPQLLQVIILQMPVSVLLKIQKGGDFLYVSFYIIVCFLYCSLQSL